LNAHELALFEEGTFLPDVGVDEFLRLSKVPESFELQMCRIAGLRHEVFEALLRVLGLQTSGSNEPMVLDVVRPLCVFVARLPDYVRTTRRLSPEASRVRDAILAAREPVTFLFKELPLACGLEPFPIDGSVSSDRARIFAQCLKRQLDELRNAFDALLERMRAAVRSEFAMDGAFDAVRQKLATRAEPVVVLASEPRIRALCLRLADANLPEAAWLESLGSLLAMQPPGRWKDADEDAFSRELHSLASRFRALETIAFEKAPAKSFVEAFRVSLTKSDGSECQQVVFVENEQLADVEALVGKLEHLVGRNKVVGMAALSRVVWSTLKKE
jgi:hypothetical protein